MLTMDLKSMNDKNVSPSARRLRRLRREAAAATVLGLAMFGWCGQSSVVVRADDAPKPTDTQGSVEAPAAAPAPTPAPVAPAASIPAEAPKAPAPSIPPVDGPATEAGGSTSSTGTSASVDKKNKEKEKPRELSTPLLTDESQFKVDRSQRPSWVEKAPTREGDEHTASVSSTPHATQRAAIEALDAELVATVAAYVEEHLDSRLAAAEIRYSAKEIKTRLVKEQIYLERGELIGSGPMYDAHAQLVFNSSFREELDQRWREVQVANRLFYFGSVAGGLIVAFGIVRWRLGRSRKAWLEPTQAAAASPVAAKRGLKSTFGTAILVAGSVAFLWATLRFLG